MLPVFLFSQIVFLFSLWGVSLGHGYVHNVVVGGQNYPGWFPFSDPYTTGPPKIVRKIASDGPVAITDPNMACNIDGNDGTGAVASASSGSQVIFQWAYWPADHQGPVSTYMASCNGNCATFSANTARWFKVDADGYDPSSKQWAAAKLIANNASWTSTIPAGLAPGQYLMRNEIVALHSSPPQPYPSCSQIEVTGTGTAQPSDSQMVSMQTLYSGVTFPNIYSDNVTFTMPGPPPIDFSGNGGGGGDTSSIPVSPSSSTGTTTGTLGSSTTSTSVSTAASQTSTICRLGSAKLRRRWR